MKKTLKISLILVALVTSVLALTIAFFALNYGWWNAQEIPQLKPHSRIPDTYPTAAFT